LRCKNRTLTALQIEKRLTFWYRGVIKGFIRMTDNQPYRVLLVDDHQMMRLGLKALAQSEANLPIEWLEASNLEDALAMYQSEGLIDLVLLDLNLPDSQGLQSLRRFVSQCPQARVALFSATEDGFVVKQALSLGAIGYVPKSAQAKATLGTIEALLAGHTLPIDSASPSLKVKPLSDTKTASLSHTQLKVLELVLDGMSNQEIAAECKLALGTVKNTVSSIMLTLEVTSRSHLISVFR
jgi:DNA-binding NarL/FixJ family response regulator